MIEPCARLWVRRLAAGVVSAFAALSLALTTATDVRAQNPEKFERVVPQKPQPAAPKGDRRSSTFEVGVRINGIGTWGILTTADARACQAACLKEPKCVGWTWSRAHRTCYPVDQILRKHSEETSTSGVIQMNTAIGDATVRELMRKAQAREPDDGFCARVNWRKVDDWHNDVPMKSVGPRGGTVLFRTPHDCVVILVAAETVRAGKRLRSATEWKCAAIPGGWCSVVKKVYCPNPNYRPGGGQTEWSYGGDCQ